MQKVVLNNGVEMPLKASSFFDHRDPEIIKWMGSRKLDL